MKKVCVVTATRAEYGLLSSVIRGISENPQLKLLLIATGMHLDKNFGETYREIEADGFSIDYKIQTNDTDTDTDLGVLKVMSNAVSKIGNVLVDEKPDMVLVLGDRYELLSIASAAVVLKIPIAHISGGEITEGAFDEYIRHAITKLSTLHFVSTEEYRKRVIQMGELPNRVFNVGDLGVENIKNLRKFTKEQIEDKIGMKIGNSLIHVTFHPETLSDNSIDQFGQLLLALEDRTELQIVFTKSNADQDGSIINSMIDQFVEKNIIRSRAFFSLGYTLFLNLLSYSIGIVGNSSSGIVEAPSLKIGTINIGNRQKGRTRAESVIDCQGKKEDIIKSIERLKSEDYRKMLRNIKSPYETNDTSIKIIKNIDDFLYINEKNIGKQFWDI